MRQARLPPFLWSEENSALLDASLKMQSALATRVSGLGTAHGSFYHMITGLILFFFEFGSPAEHRFRLLKEAALGAQL